MDYGFLVVFALWQARRRALAIRLRIGRSGISFSCTAAYVIAFLDPSSDTLWRNCLENTPEGTLPCVLVAPSARIRAHLFPPGGS